MNTGAVEPAAATPAAVKVPLLDRPGPVSRLVAWGDRRSWWGVLIVVLVCAAEFAWAHAVLWSNGRIPVGTVDANVLIFLVYAPYGVVQMAIAARIARGAVATFWPATGWPESARSAWADRFTYTPARLEVPILVIGVVAAIGSLLAARAAIVGSDQQRLMSQFAYAPMYLLGYGLSAVAVVIAIRWLGLVARIHADARAINPFDRAPIYAFSRLTVFIGLATVVATWFSFTVNAVNQAGNVPSLIIGAVSVALGVAAFVAPQWGIHERLVHEKDRLAQETERRISQVGEELSGMVDARSFDTIAAINASLQGLIALRDRIARLPTWPWPPQLLRGFLTALLLPVIVYLTSRLLGTGIGL